MGTVGQMAIDHVIICFQLIRDPVNSAVKNSINYHMFDPSNIRPDPLCLYKKSARHLTKRISNTKDCPPGGGMVFIEQLPLTTIILRLSWNNK